MRQGQLYASTTLKAELFLTCHPLGENLTPANKKRVRRRGSHSTSGLALPFSTLGCTAARPVGTRAHFKVDWSCHVIAARGKTVRRRTRRRMGTGEEQQLLFQTFSLFSTIDSNDVCLWRRTCGHCANVEPGGVMNVSAGELWSTEVRKVNLSLVVSGLSMHTFE